MWMPSSDGTFNNLVSGKEVHLGQFQRFAGIVFPLCREARKVIDQDILDVAFNSGLSLHPARLHTNRLER